MVQELPDSCLMDPIAFWLFSPYVGCITVSGYYSVFMYFLLFGVWDACGRCFIKIVENVTWIFVFCVRI